MGERMVGKIRRLSMSTTDEGTALVILELEVGGDVEVEPRRWATGSRIELEADD